MNTLNGYSKSTLTDMYALTAAGGHYPLLPSGYAYSSTAGLSRYWCRMLTCPIKHTNNDYDITLYVHSAYDNKRGFVHIRARLSTDLYVNLTQISGNLPLTAFRLYYNVDENNSAEIQLWCDCGIQWGVYNYKIISFTTRNSKETSFPGDLYAGNFSETQTLPAWEYITLTQLYTPIMKEGKSYSWYNFQQYDANDQIPSYYISDCAVINITSYKGWQPWIRAVDRDKGSWALGVNGTSVYLGYINKTNTSNDLTARWEFKSSSSTIVPGSILPTSNKSQNLGTSDYQWNAIYGKTLYENGTSLTNKYAAKEHAHSNLTLTGPLVFNGNDVDRNVIRINCTNGDADNKSNYGFTLKYLGSGYGVNNALALYADNSQETEQNLATKWLNDGTMYSRSILPHANNEFDLGSSSLNWKTIYATNVSLTGDIVIKNSGSISADTPKLYFQRGNADDVYYDNFMYNTGGALRVGFVKSSTDTIDAYQFGSSAFIPLTTNVYTLGTSDSKWLNVYATTFTGHLDGTVSMIGGDANAYRDILVTNGSNGICYSLANNVQLNYSTGDVRATSFTGKLKKMIDSTQLVGYTREISNALCLDSHMKSATIGGESWGSGENNAILTIGRFQNGNYSSQLGFTGNGLYYRTFNNKLPDTDTKFNKIVLENGGSWNISATKLSSKAIAFTPAETALTPDEVYALVDGTTIKRGTWSYAGNGYISNDTTGVGTIDLAGVTVIQADAGSSNQYTQLYLTSSTGSTEGYKPNEIFMYNKNSGYSPSWTRVLTNRNYTEYCLPSSGGTMTGTITSQSIIPSKTHTTSDTAYSLGSSSYQFNTTYTRYVDTVSGFNLRLRSGGVEHLNMINGNVNSTANIIPTVTNTYNLGNSSYKWNNIYTTHINATNVYATNLNGALSDTSLTWKTRSNDLNCTNPSLISVASMSMLSANRLQFVRPAGIIIEYSTDGGTTWEDYGCADNEKINLVSGHSNIIKAGKGLSTVATSNDKLRITIHATNAGIYTRARALLINASTNGSISQGVSRILVDIETAPRSSEDNFTVSHTGLIISGWSGWNQIPLNGVSFGGGTTQTYNTGAIRLTFYSDGAASSYTSGAHFDVRDLYLIGDTFWNTPSTMAKTGHLYDYDANQNMILPNNLITNRLITSGSGNAVCHIKGVVSSPADYIHIYAANADGSNTTRPLILQNGYGNVGIGTASPSEKLEVNGNIKATKFIGTFTGDLTGNVTGSSGSCTGTSEYAKALVVTSAIGNSNTPVYINANGVPIACSYDVDSVKTTASSTNFYIAGSSSSSTTTGTLYKSANVKVQNGTAVYASGGFYESSDARLKNFGNDINIDLDKLVKIPKKYFTWKDDKNVTLQIGTSAQAVKELYPELVGEDENGVLSVAYDKLAIIALAAVDKLYELVKSLQANGKGN